MFAIIRSVVILTGIETANELLAAYAGNRSRSAVELRPGLFLSQPDRGRQFEIKLFGFVFDPLRNTHRNHPHASIRPRRASFGNPSAWHRFVKG